MFEHSALTFIKSSGLLVKYHSITQKDNKLVPSSEYDLVDSKTV